jgi:uncharacterized membrane protein YfcA
MDFTGLIMEEYLIFLVLLPIVSFLYSSVGHGGASGYLALMALFAFPPETMKPTALILNLFVAGIAFYQYYKAGHFHLKLFIWFAIGSIPAAYLGGSFNLDPSLYKKILGVVLVFAVLRMYFQGNELKTIQPPFPALALSIGIFIGFFSGLIGIGGGILLTPLLLLLHWANIKEAAAVSALFIWVNSAAGLIGHLNAGAQLELSVLPMLLIALVGGFLGSFYGARKFKNKKLEQFLAVVLIAAACKLLVF